ncbi:MAG: hypothetical protein RLZ40_892 [Actinomycetota bacterium]
MLSGVSESPDDRTVSPDGVFDNLAGLADFVLSGSKSVDERASR